MGAPLFRQSRRTAQPRPHVEDNTGAAKEEHSGGVFHFLLEEREKTETDRILSGLPFQFIN